MGNTQLSVLNIVGQKTFLLLYPKNLEQRTYPEAIKLFCTLNSAVHDLFPANKSQITNNATSFLLNEADEYFSANEYEIATIFCILIFITRENFILSWAEHEKCFITSEPEQTV